MHCFVLGGTGFIGSHLVPFLLQQNYPVTALYRAEAGAALLKKLAANCGKEITLVAGDGRRPGEWQNQISQANVIINLAGVHIVRSWDSQGKEEILQSRVLTTRHTVQAMSSGQTLLNTSSLGFYGFQTKNQVLTEESPPGKGFLASVCQAWEQEAHKATDKGARVIIARFGIVLGHGGILEQMGKMFASFVGSRLGSGQQSFSWIHVTDLLRATLFCIQRRECQGVYNFCSPHVVSNEELVQTVAKKCNVITTIPIPAMVVRLALGEAAEVLLQGHNGYPKKLLAQGFTFAFPKLEKAVVDLL